MTAHILGLGRATTALEVDAGLVIMVVDDVQIIKPGYAVVRVVRHNGARTKDNYYFVSKQDNAWKVTAYRSLATYGSIEYMLAAFRGAPVRPDQAPLVRNLEMTLRTDAELRTWFAQNEVMLMRLVSVLRCAGGSASGANAGDGSELGILLSQHGLLRVMRDDVEGRIEITIGGVADNTVGFVYCMSGVAPAMHEDEYIWVEPLSQDWYLIRTT